MSETLLAHADPTVSAEVVDQRLAFYNAKLHTIKQLIAPNATAPQIELFLTQSARYGLDPLAKEIWLIDMGKGPIMFVGRDGFMKLAQQNPDFDGMASEVVREGEDFSYNPDTGEISHKSGVKGRVIAAYAKVFHKRRRATVFVATMEEYGAGKTGQPHSAWNKFPSSMLKKTAEANALKKAFGLSGFAYMDELDRDEIVVKEPVVHKRMPSGDEMDEALAEAEAKSGDEVPTAEFKEEGEEPSAPADPAPSSSPEEPEEEDEAHERELTEAVDVLRERGWTSKAHEPMTKEFKAACKAAGKRWPRVLLDAVEEGHLEWNDIIAFAKSEEPQS